MQWIQPSDEREQDILQMGYLMSDSPLEEREIDL